MSEILHKLIPMHQLYNLWKDHKTLRRKQRSCSVRKIFKNRKLQGDYHNLVREMRLNDPNKYFNYFRLTIPQFDDLLRIIGPKIKKLYVTTEPLPPAERLAVTLRYLASGDTMTSMSYAYRIGKTTISSIINETCNTIWETLNKEYFLQPSEEAWIQIEKDFNDIWQLPHCIGAIDGKHCIIQAPPKSGSEFYNYKKSFSMIIFAMCDAKYKFTIVDIGAKGKQSDGGVLHHSELGQRLYSDSLNIPPPAPLEVGGESFPYYFVGDEAFPLRKNLMRPFPGKFLSNIRRVFNYRLSRARRTIENSFGILSSRWRIYRRPMISSLATTEAVLKATLCLHNFLMAKNELAVGPYCPSNYVDYEENGVNRPGLWRNEMENNCLLAIGRSAANTYTQDAATIRNNLAVYFMTEGAVEFQWSKASGM